MDQVVVASRVIASLVAAANRRNLEKGGLGEMRLLGSPEEGGWCTVGFTEDWNTLEDVATCQFRINGANLDLRDHDGGDIWTVRASGNALDRFVLGL